MPSLTNVTFPPKDERDLRAAIAHYRYENLNQFFRVCGHALIAHYKRGDILASPLQFDAYPPAVFPTPYASNKQKR